MNSNFTPEDIGDKFIGINLEIIIALVQRLDKQDESTQKDIIKGFPSIGDLALKLRKLIDSKAITIDSIDANFISKMLNQ